MNASTLRRPATTDRARTAVGLLRQEQLGRLPTHRRDEGRHRVAPVVQTRRKRRNLLAAQDARLHPRYVREAVHLVQRLETGRGADPRPRARAPARMRERERVVASDVCVAAALAYRAHKAERHGLHKQVLDLTNQCETAATQIDRTAEG